MNNNDAVTLVVGGNGKTGRRVVERLRERGLTAVVASRSGEIRFDWEDESGWAPALTAAAEAGVTQAYVTYYPDLAFPEAAGRIKTFAELAVAAGVRRLVLLSGRGEVGAQRSEQMLIDSGAEWTVVRAAFMAQNFSDAWLDSVLAGGVALPAGETREPIIDSDDIADVAFAALTEDGHVGQVYEVTGPRLMSFHEIAAELSKAAGREIEYWPVSSEEFAAGLAEAGLPETMVSGLTDLFTEIMDGHNAYLTDGVQRALGRPPRDFSEYAERTAATGIWKA